MALSNEQIVALNTMGNVAAPLVEAARANLSKIHVLLVVELRAIHLDMTSKALLGQPIDRTVQIAKLAELSALLGEFGAVSQQIATMMGQASPLIEAAMVPDA